MHLRNFSEKFMAWRMNLKGAIVARFAMTIDWTLSLIHISVLFYEIQMAKNVRAQAVASTGVIDDDDEEDI